MSQLFHVLDGAFELPEAVDPKGQLISSAAGHLPTLYWPDGRWCFEANAFLLTQFSKRLSRSNRGGTLKAYAANLSPLLRFVANRISLSEITDSEFTLFVRSLSAEHRDLEPGVAKRNTNTVLAIARLSLDFLDWFGQWSGVAELVGPSGQIRAEKKLATHRGEGRVVTRLHWHHRSFPTPDPLKRRRPISADAMHRLGAAVASASSSLYLRRRRYVMLKLLEISGGRRSEIAALTVASVQSAAKMPEPKLRLMCAKRRGGKEEFRYVPVSRQDVVVLTDFISKARKMHIRKMIGGEASDCGFLLVSETTGTRLQANTITQEIAILRKAAGITEQACAHMFRHRFATKIFVALAEHHRITSKDEFRQLLFSTEKMKVHVQEWLGQSHLSSVDHYIDLAFEELAGFAQVVETVSARIALDSFETTLRHLQGELVAGAPVVAVTDRILSLMNALREDLGLRTVVVEVPATP